MIGKPGVRAPKDWRKRFLNSLSKSPVVSLAALNAGVSRVTAYNEKKVNEKFSKAWDEAYNMAYDRLDKKHFDLALHGQKRGVWKTRNGRPVKVETITEYSFQAQQWILSKHFQKYKETSRVEHVGATDAPPMQIQQLPPLLPKELEDGV